MTGRLSTTPSMEAASNSSDTLLTKRVPVFAASLAGTEVGQSQRPTPNAQPNAQRLNQRRSISSAKTIAQVHAQSVRKGSYHCWLQLVWIDIFGHCSSTWSYHALGNWSPAIQRSQAWRRIYLEDSPVPLKYTLKKARSMDIICTKIITILYSYNMYDPGSRVQRASSYIILAYNMWQFRPYMKSCCANSWALIIVSQGIYSFLFFDLLCLHVPHIRSLT